MPQFLSWNLVKKRMVHYQRYHQWRKLSESSYGADDDEESQMCGNSACNKRAKPRLLYFLFLSLVSCSLILAPQFLTSQPAFSLFGVGYVSPSDLGHFPCSSVPNGTICCDRNKFRYDICIMKGDVRTDSTSSSVFVYRTNDLRGYGVEEILQHEKIKPYTRKWETSVMNTIDELKLVAKRGSSSHHCDVRHDVPAVFFSTGGYTGNLYHEFNDGILPLYITSRHLNKKVVFVALEYHNWWITKYEPILKHLTDYPVIDFSGDNRTHCFPEAIVGLKIHDELTVDPLLMPDNKSIKDFRELLDRAYWPRISGLIQEEEREAQLNMKKLAASPSAKTSVESINTKDEMLKPKLVILSRNGSRAITNEDLLVKTAEEIGFEVEVYRPQRTTELAKIYRVLNGSDVMIGVHGAAMTHFLFMRPGSVFIQVVPLGTDWAAETYYGEPAVKLGLRYIGYKILPKESSLYDDYDKDDPVLTDPTSVNERGWEFTKRVYLDRQTVRLSLPRFRRRLIRAYSYSVARRNGNVQPQLE